MAVVYEQLEGNMVRAYSDAGKMIHGGYPEGDYAEAFDPAAANRTYVETEEFVPTQSLLPSQRKVYSTSDIIYALMTRGVYERCRAWIAEQGLLGLVLATKEFTDDLENFEAIKTGLQQLLGWTDEQVADVLAEAEV